MKLSRTPFHLAAATLLLPTLAQGAITVDGTVDAEYGSAVSVQTVQTGFGDTTAGNNNGSEINAAYARIEGGRLHLTITGNIEANFNKLNIFIDSRAGGENTLAALNYDGGAAANLAGMRFDTGVTVDFHLLARWGGGGLMVDFVDRMGGTGANAASGTATVGAGTQVQSGSLTGGPLTGTLNWGFNNTNSAGVTAGTGAANGAAAAAVTTGFELSMDLADLGSPAGDIRIVAAIGNGDHHYWSNQFLGGLPAPRGNLGGDNNGNFTGTSSGVNLSTIAGDQFFTVAIPEPSLPAIGLLSLTTLLTRRRR